MSPAGAESAEEPLTKEPLKRGCGDFDSFLQFKMKIYFKSDICGSVHT